MTIGKFVVAIAAFSLGSVALTSQAFAALTLTASYGGGPTAPNSQLVNFDNLALGSASGVSNGLGVSFTGDGLVASGTTSMYTAPYISHSMAVPFGDATVSGFDTTRYVSTGLGTVKFTMPTPTTTFGFMWGSIDTFNSLSFYSGGTLIDHLTGADLASRAVAVGNFGDVGAMGTLYVNFLSTTPFDSVVAASGGYSFEIDNVAYGLGSGGTSGAPVPEPWSIGLLALGLLGIGYTAARRSARTM